MLLVFAFALAVIDPENPPLWRGLDPGRHAVGFQAQSVRDLSRPALAAMRGDAQPGRLVQVYVWYPARPASGQRLTFGDYLDAGAGASAFASHAVELGGDSLEARAKLPELRALATAARRGAHPVPGRHPLVLFPGYRLPGTTAVLAEYLASHGFVVAAVEVMGTSEGEPEISLGGLETQVADLRVALAAVAARPYVDAARLGLIGVGFNASSALSLQLRHAGVRSLVSLDGGIPTQFEDRFLKRSPYFDPAAVRVPILALHSPHEAIDTSLWNQYRYAERHLLHFPGMTEHHFLSFGPLAWFSPAIIAKATGDPVVGFAWASRYVRRFFAWTLQNDTAGQRFVRGTPDDNRAPAGLITATLKPALPSPPTLVEAKAIVEAGGMDSLVRLVRALRAEDPHPLTPERIMEIFTWIGWRRDPDWSRREQLTRMRVELYPGSTRAHYTHANVLLERADTAEAIDAFRTALRLAPADADPALDPPTRRRIETTARERLREIERPSS